MKKTYKTVEVNAHGTKAVEGLKCRVTVEFQGGKRNGKYRGTIEENGHIISLVNGSGYDTDSPTTLATKELDRWVRDSAWEEK